MDEILRADGVQTRSFVRERRMDVSCSCRVIISTSIDY